MSATTRARNISRSRWAARRSPSSVRKILLSGTLTRSTNTLIFLLNPFPAERTPWRGLPAWCGVHDCLESSAEKHDCMGLITTAQVQAECRRVARTASEGTSAMTADPKSLEASPHRIAVTAAIITRNEEKHIARCLASLAWADEILVVDAESEDRTRAICENHESTWSGKIRFLSRRWSGFKDQRMHAMREAKNDWILVVDADEECTPELQAKLRGLLALPGGPERKAYKIRRIEYFLGKPIHHGIWNPSYQDRFFDRRGVEYVNDIHEYPVFPERPDEIHEPLLHAPDFAPERFLEKMNKYTTIEARDRVARGQRTNLIHLLGAGPAMFLKNYFYYGAYRDGMHGVIISLLEGVSRVVRHVKIWQFTRATVTPGGGAGDGTKDVKRP